MNDFDFACCLVNAILFLSNLSSKSLKMKPKLSSKDVLLGVQKAYSLRIASKLNLKADFASNGHPNGTPNGVQNRGHELAVRASVRVWASGPAEQRFWTQFGATLTSLGTNFGSILGHFANMHVSRNDPLCICLCNTYTIRAGKTRAYNTHGIYDWSVTKNVSRIDPLCLC